MTIVCGLDIGYGNTKTVTRIGADLYNIGFRSYSRTVTRPLEMEAIERGDSKADEVLVNVDGVNYAVGPHCERTGQPMSVSTDVCLLPEYLALFKGMLHYLMQAAGRPISEIDVLVVGLPTARYFDLRDRLKALMLDLHDDVPVPKGFQEQLGARMCVNVKQVICVPQPLGGFYHWLDATGRSDHEESMPKPQDETLVIDPGSCTFDWMYFNGCQPNPVKSSSEAKLGVSEVLRVVANELAKDLQLTASHVAIERALQDGWIACRGGREDFSKYQRLAEQRALEVVRQFYGSSRLDSVDDIVLVGGGARYFKTALSQIYKKIHLLDNPVMANAAGFRLIGERHLTT